MQTFLITTVIFLAVLTQSVSGFGVALVAMALLTQLIEIHLATPLVTLVAISLEIVLLIRYRHDLNLKAVWQISAASVIGVPIGIVAFKKIEEDVVLTVLGMVLLAYALYALLNLKLPRLAHQGWAYSFGLVAGILAGAYNTSGPPVIIYGNCRGWLPAEFKGNLQGFFLLNGIFVLIGHALAQNLTLLVWQTFLWTLPAIGLGVVVGLNIDRHLNQVQFRKVVLGLLVVLGLRLIF